MKNVEKAFIYDYMENIFHMLRAYEVAKIKDHKSRIYDIELCECYRRKLCHSEDIAGEIDSLNGRYYNSERPSMCHNLVKIFKNILGENHIAVDMFINDDLRHTKELNENGENNPNIENDFHELMIQSISYITTKKYNEEWIEKEFKNSGLRYKSDMDRLKQNIEYEKQECIYMIKELRKKGTLGEYKKSKYGVIPKELKRYFAGV